MFNSLWLHGHSLPGSSAHGTLQARILEWVAISSSRGSSRPKDQSCISWISCIGRWTLSLHHLGSKAAAVVPLLSCLTLCDSMDWSTLDFPVPGRLLKLISIESYPYLTVSSSAALFYSCPHSWPASGFFQWVGSIPWCNLGKHSTDVVKSICFALEWVPLASYQGLYPHSHSEIELNFLSWHYGFTSYI